MTPSLTQANTITSASPDDRAKKAPASSETTTLAMIAKRFWAYTDATGETNTKSFEGLL